MVEFEVVDDDEGETVLPNEIILTVVVEKPDGEYHRQEQQLSRQEFRVSRSHIISSNEVMSMILSEGGVPSPYHVKAEAINYLRNAVSGTPANEHRLYFYFVLSHRRNTRFFCCGSRFGDEKEDFFLQAKQSMFGEGGFYFKYLRQLKSVIVAGHKDGNVCSVCLEDVVGGDAITRLPCSHCFHCDCIIKWLDRNQSCPLCRYGTRLRRNFCFRHHFAGLSETFLVWPNRN